MISWVKYFRKCIKEKNYMALILSLQTVQLVGMIKDNELLLFLWTQPGFHYFLFHKGSSTNFPNARLF